MENFETFRLDQTGQQTQAILDQVSTNTADIAQLRALYEALTQNEPVIIQPSDTWPVADPQENVIYRVIDRVNTPPQSYSDYMWNGTAMVLMATYNNAIDNEPTPGSNNLVKSGGVAASIVFDISAYHATGSTLATYSNLAAALGSDGVNVPASVRKGGMSVKFVQSSDNKYVQYRCIADEFTTDTTQWAIADEGVYVDNPEFIYVKTDAENKILWAIRTDGTFYYGAGVPQQVIDYIEKKISDLSLDEYEDIVAFLDGIINKQPIFTNKKVSIIGDSISTFAGYIPDSYPSWYPHENDRSSDVVSVNDTWWKKLIDATNSTLVVNASASGSTASSNYIGFSPRVSMLGNSDVIIVALGTNDSARSVPIGDVDFDAESYDLTQFAPAYIKGIKDTMSRYPYARIICLAFDMGIEYQNTIKTIAGHYGIEYIYVGDISDVHPNKAEMQAVFEKIYNTYTLSGLLSNKVDKEGGKSLIDAEYANGVHYIENPEFIRVVTNNEDRILYAVKADGDFYFGAGVPQQIIDYVIEHTNATKEELLTLINTKVDKEEGKSLINDVKNRIITFLAENAPVVTKVDEKMVHCAALEMNLNRFFYTYYSDKDSAVEAQLSTCDLVLRKTSILNPANDVEEIARFKTNTTVCGFAVGEKPLYDPNIKMVSSINTLYVFTNAYSASRLQYELIILPFSLTTGWGEYIPCSLSYNGTTYPFTVNGLKELYNTELGVVPEVSIISPTSKIKEYNGEYYTAVGVGGISYTGFIMKSSDLISWELISFIPSNYEVRDTNVGEACLEIDGDYIYVIFRKDLGVAGAYLTRYNMSNNNWDAVHKLEGGIACKPWIELYNGHLFIFYNVGESGRDRKNLVVKEVDENMNVSDVVSFMTQDSMQYPYLYNYGGTLYMIYTQSKRKALRNLAIINMENFL